MQGHRPQTVCHQNNLQSAALALADHIRNLGQARLVILVDRKYDEFQFAGIVLSQERCRFGKIEVAPGFAQFGFHVLDKKIKFLHVTGHGDRAKRLGLG